MHESTDIRQFDKVLYEKYLDHGLIDIGLGLMFVSIFFAWIFEGPMSLFIIVLPILFMSSFGSLLWQKVISPRLGYVKWGGLSSGKMNKLAVLLVSIVAPFFILAIILVVFYNNSTPSDWLIEMHLIIIGTLCLIIFSITGFITGIQRFYFYGVGAIFIFNMAHLLNTSAYLSFGILGIIILVIGIYLLIQFLKNHPVLGLEGDDVDP